ncbi:hypothetical protein AVEN_188617-1 [Araneus ventricosus]|uniref:Uncharacterized protein n=1 Tax=Araneus ventricosus TaxID=182803 RepID=A0A4Y2JPC3_ARAVE|nr:hypothetical protein AVEN_188617-1 [Araneus ventricosus]
MTIAHLPMEFQITLMMRELESCKIITNLIPILLINKHRESERVNCFETGLFGRLKTWTDSSLGGRYLTTLYPSLRLGNLGRAVVGGARTTGALTRLSP